MDDLDLQIISVLQQDGRIGNADLARQILPSPSKEETVRRRRSRLVREGDVRITSIPDPEKMGYVVQVMIGLCVEPGRIEETSDALCEIDEVGFVWVTTGPFDIFMWATIQSFDDLRDLLRGRVNRIQGVTKTEVFPVLESKKREYGMSSGSIRESTDKGLLC